MDFIISIKTSSNFMEREETFDLDSDLKASVLRLSERMIQKETRRTLINKTMD